MYAPVPVHRDRRVIASSNAVTQVIIDRHLTLGGVVARLFDCQPSGRGFKSTPGKISSRLGHE